MRTLAIVLALSFLSVSARARAESSGPSLVRGYFAALERKDFDRALSLTAGAALTRTADMVGTLNREAANHHAEVELRVTKLELANPPSGPNGTTPVKVNFGIDVIGKKWIFRKVARRLRGQAQFYVTADQIVAIDGQIW
jgi:hypothetical protein